MVLWSGIIFIIFISRFQVEIKIKLQEVEDHRLNISNRHVTCAQVLQEFRLTILNHINGNFTDNSRETGET